MGSGGLCGRVSCPHGDYLQSCTPPRLFWVSSVGRVAMQPLLGCNLMGCEKLDSAGKALDRPNRDGTLSLVLTCMLTCTYTCCSLPEPPSACQSRQQLQFSSLLQRFCCRRCCNAEAGVELPYYFGGRPLAMHVCLVGCAQPHARNLLQCNIVRAAPSRLAAGAQHSQSVACMPQLFPAAHCQQMYALFTVTFKTCMLSISWQLRCCWH